MFIFTTVQTRNFTILSSRTVSNCARKPANNGGGWDNTIQTEEDQNNSPKEVKSKLRELGETPKLESKFCKKNVKKQKRFRAKF